MIDLPEHESECPSCEGYKVDPDSCDAEDHDDNAGEDGACPECPECSDCDGTGKAAWMWSHEETMVCDVCTEAAMKAAANAILTMHGWGFSALEQARTKAARDVPEVPCDRWGEDGDEAICLPCALAYHARVCGCDKWPKEVAS